VNQFPGHLLILIVEDDALQRIAAADLFEAVGCRVLEAATVKKALVLLKANLDIDLVFTDLNLAGVESGLDLALNMAENFPGVPLIMVSGHECPGDLPFGAGFHQKPYDLNAVLQQAGEMTAARVH
jgi:CheY-like chemotaxis protein